MNETAMYNAGGMYDEVAQIQNLNKVEGFDPRKYMRIIQREGQAGKYYLDVVYRKLWFRLRYPEGKIVKKILKLTEQMAIVEAKVYLSRNDAEENFISNALAQKYMTADEQFGNKFVELAETAAVGRALADAGFGLQFADTEGEFDPEVTDAPFDSNLLQGDMPVPNGTYMDEELMNQEDGAGTRQTDLVSDYDLPGQYGIESYMPMPDEGVRASGNTPAAALQPEQMSQQISAMQQNQQMNTSSQSVPVNNLQAANNGKSSQSVNQIDKKLPMEQIYSIINRDIAAAVVIPMGFNKGKTLGQVAIEKPSSLEWYITSYGGPDNLLRAAAKFLMDAALGQAS